MHKTNAKKASTGENQHVYIHILIGTHYVKQKKKIKKKFGAKIGTHSIPIHIIPSIHVHAKVVA